MTNRGALLMTHPEAVTLKLVLDGKEVLKDSVSFQPHALLSK